MESKLNEKKKKQVNAAIRTYRRVAAPFKRFYDTNTAVGHLRRFLNKNNEDNISALSGQSAFFVILSILPLAMFIISLFSLFGALPAFKNTEAIVLRNLSLFELLFAGIVRNASENASGTAIVTIVVALWSSGKGMYIITDGISRIYRLPRKHVWVFRRVFAMGYTLVLLMMVSVGFGMLILNRMFEDYVSSAVGDIPMSTEILYGLRYVISTLILILFMTTALKLYLRRKLKDKRYRKFRVLLPGAIFTAISWSLLTRGVEFYNAHFTSSMYGSLGTIIVIMMWIYFMMYLLLCGVQINYIYRDVFYRFRFRTFFACVKRKFKRKKKAGS